MIMRHANIWRVSYRSGMILCYTLLSEERINYFETTKSNCKSQVLLYLFLCISPYKLKIEKKIIFSRNTVRNDILENNWRISLNLYTNPFFSKIKLINNASGSPIKTRSTSMGNTNQRKRIRDSNKIRNGSWLSDNGVCRDYACAKLRPRDGDGWEEFAVADVPAIPPPYQIIIMINLRAALLPHTYSPAHKCGRVIFVSSWNWISAFK